MQGRGEVNAAPVGAEARAGVVGRGGGQLPRGRQRPGRRAAGGIGRGLAAACRRRAFNALPWGATRGSAPGSGTSTRKSWTRLVRGVPDAVHPVLVVGDQPCVLAAGGDPVGAAVPAVLRSPGAVDNVPGIGRPRERGHSQRRVGDGLRLAAGGLHDMELGFAAGGGAQECQHLPVRREVRRRVAESAGQAARRAGPGPAAPSTAGRRTHRRRSRAGAPTRRHVCRPGAGQGRRRNSAAADVRISRVRA